MHSLLVTSNTKDGIQLSHQNHFVPFNSMLYRNHQVYHTCRMLQSDWLEGASRSDVYSHSNTGPSPLQLAQGFVRWIIHIAIKKRVHKLTRGCKTITLLQTSLHCVLFLTNTLQGAVLSRFSNLHGKTNLEQFSNRTGALLSPFNQIRNRTLAKKVKPFTSAHHQLASCLKPLTMKSSR